MNKLLTGVLFAGMLFSNAGIAVAAAKEVRIASHVSEASPLFANSKLFVEKMSAKFPGKFDFKFFPNGQLGKEPALIDNIKLGSLEMAFVASGVLKLDDKLGIFDLPWLFDNREHLVNAVNSDFGKEVINQIEDKQGFIVLGIYENGFRHVINTKRPVLTPADMGGLKIRVTGSKFKRDGFTAMGADPVPVAWQETFTAIQQGVVDGAEAALYGFYGAKLYEINDYISLTNHTYSPSFLTVSKAFWATLSDDEKNTFHQVAQDMQAEAFAQAADLEAGYLEKMKSQIKINDVDPAPFQEKAKSVYATYTSKFGNDWLDMIKAAK
ncbi:MAG: TRAP transporter substrate-binding protein [Rhodospirillales bacterium]